MAPEDIYPDGTWTDAKADNVAPPYEDGDPLARDERRREIAERLARETYENDDVEILPGRWLGEEPEPLIESVDGGYWVQARVWVDSDGVEAALLAEESVPPDWRWLTREGA